MTTYPGDWVRRSACRRRDVNPDWWAEPGNKGLARHICRSHCPVLTACNAWATTGTWDATVVGGLLRREDGRPSSRQPALTRAGCPICHAIEGRGA